MEILATIILFFVFFLQTVLNKDTIGLYGALDDKQSGIDAENFDTCLFMVFGGLTQRMDYGPSLP